MWCTRRYITTRTTLLDSGGNHAFVITKINYLTSPYRAQHPTYVTHFHSTRRNKAINPMTAQTRAPCTVRYTAPVSHYSTFHSPFALRNIGPIPISTKTSLSHPPEFPLQHGGQMTPQWRQSGCITNQQCSSGGSNPNPQVPHCTCSYMTPYPIHPLNPYW